jgi:hypothetical protein
LYLIVTGEISLILHTKSEADIGMSMYVEQFFMSAEGRAASNIFLAAPNSITSSSASSKKYGSGFIFALSSFSPTGKSSGSVSSLSDICGFADVPAGGGGSVVSSSGFIGMAHDPAIMDNAIKMAADMPIFLCFA